MSLKSREWLVWLGISQPNQSRNSMDGDVQRLKEHVGDYDAFQSLVEGSTSYSEYHDDLVAAGFTEDEAEEHVQRVENNYDEWSEYEQFVLDQDTYERYKSGFGTLTGVASEETTEDGEPVAGIRVHDSPGISYAGVPVDAGTTEVFGRRIEFSQQDAAVDPEDVMWSNMDTDAEDNVVNSHQTITFSADATNPNGYSVTVTAPYQEDGEVVRRTTIDIPANGTRTVEFEVTKTEYICVEAAIGTTDPITACWVPAGLTA